MSAYFQPGMEPTGNRPLFDNVLSKILIYFPMTWYWLGYFTLWILIPIVSASMSDKNAAHVLYSFF